LCRYLDITLFSPGVPKLGAMDRCGGHHVNSGVLSQFGDTNSGE